MMTDDVLEACVASSVDEDAAQRATLVWKDLTCIVGKGSKVLLESVSGEIAGGFVAVMGPSGSGKSTLLNCLACRLDKGAVMTGEVRLNGKKYGIHELKQNAGYGAEHSCICCGGATQLVTLP